MDGIRCRPARLSLAVTAWSLWKQRQILLPAAIITSVLLLCDAWFDLLTANGHRQLILSAVTALFGELPLAAMLCLVSVRFLRLAGRAARGMEQGTPVSPLWRTPLLTTSNPQVHTYVEPWPHVGSADEADSSAALTELSTIKLGRPTTGRPL